MTWWVGLVDFGGESEVQQDGRCLSRYTRKYLVRTNLATLQNESQVAAAVGILRGSPLASDTNATCYRLTISPGPTMTRPPFAAYYATYEWSTAAAYPNANNNDPTSMRTQWSVSPQIQSRYVIRDRSNNLIVNSAGSPFDGGIPIDVRLGSVTAVRNITASGYNLSAVLANSGKLNSATYLGGAVGTVQVDISAAEKYEGGYHYWAETYTFSYDPEGWQPKPANAGFFQRSAVGSNVLLRIINSDVGDTIKPREPVQEPEPLDADGILVPPASRPVGCTFATVDYFATMDFSTFGL